MSKTELVNNIVSSMAASSGSGLLRKHSKYNKGRPTHKFPQKLHAKALSQAEKIAKEIAKTMQPIIEKLGKSPNKIGQVQQVKQQIQKYIPTMAEFEKELEEKKKIRRAKYYKDTDEKKEMPKLEKYKEEHGYKAPAPRKFKKELLEKIESSLKSKIGKPSSTSRSVGKLKTELKNEAESMMKELENKPLPKHVIEQIKIAQEEEEEY